MLGEAYGSEVAPHGGQVGTPDGELEEVHHRQAELDV